GPQVAVVTGRVTAGEDVAETVRKPLPGRRMQHRDLLARLLQHLQRARTTGGVVFQMKQEVEQRELQLTYQEQSGVKMSRSEHALEQLGRQPLACLPVSGKQIERLAVPAEVLHELAGQFHRVPLDA